LACGFFKFLNKAIISMSTNLRTITIPAGLGDACWILQKIIHAKEKFHFKLPDGIPQRGKQLFDLLPQIAESCDYVPGLSYSSIDSTNLATKGRKWADIKKKEFTLSANRWLENGNRIEGFLPDLPTSFTLDFQTSQMDIAKAGSLLDSPYKYFGIYGSAYSNARHNHYNGWGPDEWFAFIRMIYSRSREYRFVIIGANYDEDLADMLMSKLIEYNIPYINTIGQPLSVVIEILKRLVFFTGFPSGLSIINELLGKDGVMFYGHKVAGIINTWADPARIKAGNIKECQFCAPEQIFQWLTSNKKI
jgi:hypothetical protein